MDLEFRNLRYTVKNTGVKGQRASDILKSVNGKFYSGTLSAIIGQSGAGKSSLLNALSGYRSKGVTGDILVSGQEINSREFHKRSCYLTQEDLLQPLLTAGELMALSATLKLPKGSEKKLTCAAILKNMGLLEHQHTRIEKLSGGQRRRLSIALELVNNPPVFFLDEPTSGLDQVTSSHCVKLLRSLAKEGRTVICTIHQPSASIFEQFDQVYVLAQGQCIYQGSTKALVPFLSSVGLPCPVHYNPADFIIELSENETNVTKLSVESKNGKVFEVVEGSTPDRRDDKTTINNNFNSISGDLNACIRKQSNISQISNVGLTTAWLKMREYSIGTEVGFETTSLTQFRILLRRMFVQIKRNSVGIYIQTFHHILCGILIGLTFFGSANDASSLFNHLKFCVGVAIFFTYTQIMVPVLVYPQELALVRKEYFNRWYGLTPYYAALTVSKLPLQIVLNVIFSALVYFMWGMPFELIRFTVFCMVGNLVSLAAEGAGLAIGSAFNVTNGCAVGPLTSAVFLGLAIYGFDYAKDITWFMYLTMKISFVRCGVVAFVLTVFGFERQQLECNDVYCHYSKPELIINFLDINKQTVWLEMLLLLALTLLFRYIAFANIKRRFSR